MTYRRWRRVTVVLGVFALGFAVRTAAAQATPAVADAIIGTWLTEDSTAKVTIADSSGTFSGTIVWVKPDGDGAEPLDAKNADTALRTRPILGIRVLTGFVSAGNGVWSRGKVYSPTRGHTYGGQLTLLKDGRLAVEGKSGPISKTETWTRQ